MINPSGLCFCGCGETTRLAPQTRSQWGYRKGEHVPYVNGHNISPPVESPSESVKLTHGHRRARTLTYNSWRSMIQRCTKESQYSYRNYGGRGVVIHPAWMVYENFLADVGERPEGCTLDRIDPEGDYVPGNVRWATAVEQQNNRRNNRRNERDERKQNA
jgi:hypothetical protein